MANVSAVNISQFTKANPGLLTKEDAKPLRRLTPHQKELFLNQKLMQKYDKGVQDSYRALVRNNNIANAGKAKIKPTAQGAQDAAGKIDDVAKSFWGKLKNVNKKWWIGGAAVIVLLGGLLAAANKNKTAEANALDAAA